MTTSNLRNYFEKKKKFNLQSQTNSPIHQFEKSTEDYDFVDVEGDVCMDAELSGRPVAMKKDVLEEGSFYVIVNKIFSRK